MTNHEITVPEQESHTVSLFVSNKPGVLLRICLVFSRRGFNIESLVVSPAFDGKFSRMTITAKGARKTLDQIIKQCAKLIDVVSASEHNLQNSLELEFALIKVTLLPEKRVELLQLIDHFQGKSIDFSSNNVIFQLAGTSEKLDSCINLLQPFGLQEMVRSGKMVISKGSQKT